MKGASLQAQIGQMARRSILQTLRQPAMVIPPIVFPLLLMSINVGGLEAATNIPGFPVDSYLDFAIAVPFVQALTDMGELDNTLFFYIVGDNGSSAEGGPDGTYNETLALNGIVSPAAVPEPGSIVLLSLTGLAAVGVRSLRRRRNRQQGR